MAETDDKDYAGETGQVGDTHSNRTSEDQPRGIELQVMKSREPAAADGDAGAPPPLESDGKWREAFPKGRFLKHWYRTSCGKQACCCACNCLFHSCRSLVSQNKKRIRRNGFDLDLTYLTNRIIVMGFPAVGLEHTYRNPRAELRHFLNDNHGKDYKVFNFCCEAGRGYSPSLFDGRVERYPFLDHGSPYLQTMTNFCDSAAQWLNDDPNHLVALHCLAGKGRAGIMACCLLLRMGHCVTAAEAIALYGRKRTWDGQGLTVPSQRRSVGDYERCWRMQANGMALPEPPRYTLVKLELENPSGKQMRISFRLSLGAGATIELKYESATAKSVLSCDVPVKDVVQVELFRVKAGKKKKLCVYSFNTMFLDLPVDGSNTIRIPKCELDKLCEDKKHKKVPEDFQLVLYFKPDSVVATAMPNET